MANEQTINSNEYIIFIDTTTSVTASAGAAYLPVICAVSNGISISRDSIDVNNKCNEGFSNSRPGNGSWEMTGDGHAIDETGSSSMVSFQTIAELALEEDKLFWAKIGKKDGTAGLVFREGVVWISSYDETADTDSPYSFSFTFTGVGKPTLVPTT